MACYLSEPGVEFEISTFFVNIFKNRSKFKKNEKTPPRQFYPGGYSDLSWTGVCRSSLKTPTIFKGDFGRKEYPFLRIFLEK